MTRWGTNKFRVSQLLRIHKSLRIRAYQIRLSMVSFRNDANMINVILKMYLMSAKSQVTMVALEVALSIYELRANFA